MSNTQFLSHPATPPLCVLLHSVRLLIVVEIAKQCGYRRHCTTTVWCGQ